MDIYNLLLIFTGTHSQEFALSLRGDFGFKFWDSAGSIKTLGTLRWTECILHFEIHSAFGTRGRMWFGYEVSAKISCVNTVMFIGEVTKL